VLGWSNPFKRLISIIWDGRMDGETKIFGALAFFALLSVATTTDSANALDKDAHLAIDQFLLEDSSQIVNDMVFRINIKNMGAIHLNEVEIIDELPSGVAYLSSNYVNSSDPLKIQCLQFNRNGSARNISWNLGELGTGQERWLELKVAKIAKSINASTNKVAGKARISVIDKPQDENIPKWRVISAADLMPAKLQISSPSEANAAQAKKQADNFKESENDEKNQKGSEIEIKKYLLNINNSTSRDFMVEYLIFVKNTGNSLIYNVNVTDNLPIKMELNETNASKSIRGIGIDLKEISNYKSDNCTYNVTKNNRSSEVIWNLDSLGINETVWIWLVTEVGKGLANPLENNATIEGVFMNKSVQNSTNGCIDLRSSEEKPI
jgi:uncharacterized repeat protein (TIGR01451 family)